jgi:uncharacterized protein
VRDATDVLVGFGRTLRAAGVEAGPDRVQRMADALGVLDPTRRADVYWAGRLTLCADPEDLARYDRVFSAYFGGATVRLRERQTPGPRVSHAALDDGAAAEESEANPATARVVSASSRELLRHRDFAALTADERALLDRLLATFRLPGVTRRTRRWQPGGRRAVDRSRSVRAMLHAGGEPARLRHRVHRRRPRRVVLLVDVSGSMEPYASALLRFAHAARLERPTEVFTIGTRLTRVTREIGHRDPDTAMAAVSAAIPDWSGGTQLGARMKEFLDRWGQRGLARGAVVVVLSDGWERADPAVLGEQVARLSRLAHRVVWSNPRKARPGYEPLAGGMAAALPYVDEFVEGHSLSALERLARVVAAPAGRRSHA